MTLAFQGLNSAVVFRFGLIIALHVVIVLALLKLPLELDFYITHVQFLLEFDLHRSIFSVIE